LNRNQKISTIFIFIIIPFSIWILILIKWLDVTDFKNYVIGGALAVGSLFLSNDKLKDKKKSHSKRIFLRWFRKPTYKARIINQQTTFIVGSVNLTFQSEFTGELKNGYFVNEIIFPENTGMNDFTKTMPDLINNRQGALSFCDETIKDKQNRIGILNGHIESSYTWSWYIPNQNGMPLGNYRVRMMVFNEREGQPLHTIESAFTVTNNSTEFDRVRF
jgi:hypothetical protein